MRWPSTRTSVASSVSPRSDTPLAPPASAPLKFWVSEPLLSAETLRMTSEIVVMPLLSISSLVISCTGEGVSVSVRRTFEPVTVTVIDGVADLGERRHVLGRDDALVRRFGDGVWLIRDGRRSLIRQSARAVLLALGLSGLVWLGLIKRVPW